MIASTMAAPYPQLVTHLVWSTWQRLPLLTTSIEAEVHASLAFICRRLACWPIAIGGTDDHVHVLVHLHRCVAIATLLKEIKGASSHQVNHQLAPGGAFKWQGGYGAVAVSKHDLPRVRAYVETQRARHAVGKLIRGLETTSA